jgi:phage terminase large subunit-like protein
MEIPKLNPNELSEADKFALLPEETRNKILEGMTPEQLKELYQSWEWWARPKQLRCFEEDWTTFMFAGGRGTGKALNPEEPILTSNRGWITFGALIVGDTVYDEQGNETKVTNIFEVPNPEKVYKLYFNDNTTIVACGDHQWSTWTQEDRKRYYRTTNKKTFPKNWVNYNSEKVNKLNVTVYQFAQIKNDFLSGFNVNQCAYRNNVSWGTAKSILDGKFDGELLVFGKIKTTNNIVETFYQKGKRKDLNHCIINTQPLNYEKKHLPIDPYVLGAWIGDGHKRSGRFTQDHKTYDKKFLMEQISQYYRVTESTCNKTCFTAHALVTDLKYLDLYKNKHIPDLYLKSSVEQRLSLLQGLMDTDGSVSSNGTLCEFSQSDESIAFSVYELIVSLGMKVTIKNRYPKYPYKGKKVVGQKNWRLTFTPTMKVFRFPRKAEKLVFEGNQYSKRLHRMLTKYEELPSIPMRCITVDSPNNMFLIGKQLLPTHNSHPACQWVVKKARENPGCTIGVVGATAQITNRTVIRGSGGIIESLKAGEAQHKRGDAIIQFKNGSVINIFSADVPERLRGSNLHFALADDIIAWKNPETYHMLRLATRIGRKPQVMITTSPAAFPLLLHILTDGSEEDSVIEAAVEEFNSKEYIKRDNLVVVRGTTFENTHLPTSVLEDYLKLYPPTTVLGQQELYGRIVLKVEGALWAREWIQHFKTVSMEPATMGEKISEPEYIKTIIAVDPAVSVNKNSDYTAIVVSSKTVDGRYFVRFAERFKTTPATWAQEVVRLYHKFKCDKIVAEANNGGLLVEETLRSQTGFKLDGRNYEIDGNSLPIELIYAKQGKYVRATPVAFLYEDKRVWHVGTHNELESQMLSFKGEPNGSDDLVDALVYTLLELSGARIVPVSPPAVGGYRQELQLDFL